MRRPVAVGMLIVAALTAAPTAHAANQVWNGKYSLVRYAAQKTGTSLAARQPEPTFSDVYTFSTDCSSSTCISTVIDGPTPKNPTLPLPPRYTWDGTRWVHIYDWQWDCYMGEGVPKVWAPARSWAYYAPQPDGTLRGTWLTQIAGGPCGGTVQMEVAAFPA
ncbi:hypothetical protein [Mycolicibacterium mageritense]|uniref:Secreted protein n=1 Tax=Mycolicibacterium mageritense TaxID=53462 RepID=A0ABM7HKV0_MYCME|nr:hypothetical protein MMAGJ_04030 [Mycolicibacterium mageritense]CDO24870.1 secreted protein [Mycolicibacterium mageritense DSM 44476 = CIP 104973]